MITGNLITGEGLETAMRGVDVIVHCASSPIRTRQVDVIGTERLLRLADRAGVSHVVFISIVGVDQNPYFPFYRMKLETERFVENYPVPWTILRAIPYHEFVLGLIGVLSRLPVMLTPKGFVLQPIDVGEVAERVTELALSEPARRVPDVGGPEVRTFANLTRAYLIATRQRRRIVRVPLPGKMARSFREGAQLAPDGAYGEIRWEEFLRRTIQDKGRRNDRGGSFYD